MNATLDLQDNANDSSIDEQTLRSLAATELVMVGGGEFVLIGS